MAQNSSEEGQLSQALYDELRRLARFYLSGERSAQTLQPTALVHEAYLRLQGQNSLDWSNRGQVIGIAAGMMRRILLNHARARRAAKRDRPATVALYGMKGASEADVLDLNRALQRLGELDTRQERIVELRFFGGLSLEETASLLDIAPATVKRDWTTARMFLLRQLSENVQP